MADPRPSSSSLMRLASASVAAIAALGVVALGVRIGTDGLGTAAADRRPASGTATPAAAVVDLARARAAGPSVEIAPVVDTEAEGSSDATIAPTAPPAVPAPSPTPAPSPGPLAAPGPTPSPPPSPGEPLSPVPVEPPVPVTVPAPLPLLEPVDEIIDAVTGLSLGL